MLTQKEQALSRATRQNKRAAVTLYDAWSAKTRQEWDDVILRIAEEKGTKDLDRLERSVLAMLDANQDVLRQYDESGTRPEGNRSTGAVLGMEASRKGEQESVLDFNS